MSFAASYPLSYVRPYIFMKYTQYIIEQLIADEYFKSWVINPNKESDFYWKSFLENHPDRKKEILKAREIILLFDRNEYPSLDPSEEEKFDLFNRIIDAKSLPSKSLVPRSTILYNHWTSIGWVSRAASILLIGMFIAILWARSHHVSVEVRQTVFREITCEAQIGQKLTVHLEDGTLVKLNSGSRLKYPERFNDSRNVILEGEAYFEVEKDPERPFIVTTRDMETMVLGTSFNVKENILKGKVEIGVLSGKVAVRAKAMDSNNCIELVPNQMAVYTVASKSLVNSEFDYDQIFSWKDNVLYFEDASFEEMLDQLQKWYGIRFIVEKTFSNVNRKDFRGKYYNKTLEAVLTGLGFAYGFDFEINNDVVIIK
jgi:ferric-dicitrate binding protein FerR (iron transport regulator)